MTKKFGLIGHPIAHSQSPLLFQKAYNGRYQYDLIEGDDFETSYEKFLSDYQAINITAPFKQQAFEKAVALAHEGKGLISGPCFKIKATNLLVKGPEGIEAHNSDFTGIILSVAEAYFPGLTAQCYARFGSRGHIKVHQFFRQNLSALFAKKPQALIVGCGGAGRAAAVAAAEMGFDVALMNRTPEKAQALADELSEYNFIAVPISDFRASFKECELVIYTLPTPLDAIADLTIDDFAGFNHNLVAARQAGSDAEFMTASNQTTPSNSNGSSTDSPDQATDSPADRHNPSEQHPSSDFAPITPSKVILEANYKSPAFTGTLLDKISYAGALYLPGKAWLLNQALTGYGLMTGEQPDIEALFQ